MVDEIVPSAGALEPSPDTDADFWTRDA